MTHTDLTSGTDRHTRDAQDDEGTAVTRRCPDHEYLIGPVRSNCIGCMTRRIETQFGFSNGEYVRAVARSNAHLQD